MKRKNKIFTLVLAGLMTAGLLSGCGADSKNDNAISAAKLNVNGKEVDVPYVMTIDGHKVSLDEYRYYYLNTKIGMDGGDDSIWTDNEKQQNQLKAEVLNYLKAMYSVQALADENKTALSKEEIKTVDDNIAKTKKSYGSEQAYQDALKSSYLTEDLYRQLLLNDALQNKLKTTIYNVSKDEMKNILDKDYIRAVHILIPPDSADSDANLKKAQEALAKAKKGDDFNKLIEEYGTDSGMKGNPDGYYFTHGEMIPEFETAAFHLKENEISDIVKSDYGYHIIKRLPMDEKYIETNMDTLISNYESIQLSDALTKKMDQVKVEYGDQFDLINTDSLV